VRQQETLAEPAVMGLLKRAAVDYPGTTPLEFAGYVQGNIGRSDWGVFVGTQQGVPKSIVIVLLPCPFTIAPQVVLAYNEGTRGLGYKVGIRVKRWILENGYTHALALNLRHPEALFCRLFARFGKPERFGQVIRFILDETG
jgi:hypothetical protein